MRPTFKVFLLFLITQIASQKDPFSILIAYEDNQRISAGVGESHYQLLPFRVSGTSQNFIQAPQIDEYLNVEVIVHWINNNSTLEFPQFDLSQKIRLVIEEQITGTVPKKPVLTKEFLTQTGFKVQLSAGHRYRWKIESSGLISKIVEIAIVKKPRNSANSTNSSLVIKETHQKEVEVLREMTKTLEKAKYTRTYRESKISKTSQSEVVDIWAWMSGMEMVSLLAFLLVQLALFQKFMLPTSVV